MFVCVCSLRMSCCLFRHWANKKRPWDYLCARHRLVEKGAFFFCGTKVPGPRTSQAICVVSWSTQGISARRPLISWTGTVNISTQNTSEFELRDDGILLSCSPLRARVLDPVYLCKTPESSAPRTQYCVFYYFQACESITSYADASCDTLQDFRLPGIKMQTEPCRVKRVVHL